MTSGLAAPRLVTVLVTTRPHDLSNHQQTPLAVLNILKGRYSQNLKALGAGGVGKLSSVSFWLASTCDLPCSQRL